MAPDPKDVLGLARAARSDGRFEEALAHYEYFFDHALDEDPHSLYGVRLSYCLSEWAELGEQYPLARERLERRAEATERELAQSKRPPLFHDLVSINECLGRQDASMAVFMAYHDGDRAFSALIVRYVWDLLVKHERWDVCAEYLGRPLDRYHRLLRDFDALLRMSAQDPKAHSLGLDRFAKTDFVNDVIHIGRVLAYANRHDELRQVLEQAESDLASRQWPELMEQIRRGIART